MNRKRLLVWTVFYAYTCQVLRNKGIVGDDEGDDVGNKDDRVTIVAMRVITFILC